MFACFIVFAEEEDGNEEQEDGQQHFADLAEQGLEAPQNFEEEMVAHPDFPEGAHVPLDYEEEEDAREGKSALHASSNSSRSRSSEDC